MALKKKNYILERSIGHILDVSVNANNINISNMAVLQIKKWRWGRLSQISRGKLSQVVCVCVCVCVKKP